MQFGVNAMRTAAASDAGSSGIPDIYAVAGLIIILSFAAVLCTKYFKKAKSS